MRTIFISYRRANSAAMCDRIYGKLAEVFGKEAVFKDIEAIELGTNFKQRIEEAVSKSSVLLAVMGPGWAEMTNPDGQQRLNDPNDFVRIEIEHAMRRNIPIIPLLVDGATMPAADKLPVALQPLTLQNGTPIRYDPDFNHDMDRLTEGLEKFGITKVMARTATPSVPMSTPITPQPYGYNVVYPTSPVQVVIPGSTTPSAPAAPAKRKRSPWRTVIISVIILGLLVGLCAGTITIIRNIANSIVQSINGNITEVNMVSDTEGWAIGGITNPVMLHYTNSAWKPITAPSGASALTSISMISSTEGWAVGGSGTILHYSNGTWTTEQSPTNLPLSAVSMISSSEGWAVGNGIILHYLGSAGGWQIYNDPASSALDSVSMVSSTNGWASGEGGTILHYNGQGWSVFTDIQYVPNSAGTADSNESLNSVDMLSAGDGWIVGSNGMILHYSHGSWQQVALGQTNQALNGLAMDAKDNGWAVGANGTILRCNSGKWGNTNSSPTNNILRGVSLTPGGDAWAVGDSNTVLHYTSGVPGAPIVWNVVTVSS